jgi:hypothetical protein
MAEKTYEVKTPIMHNGKSIDAGDVIDMDEKKAAQLVAAGALEEQLSSDKAKKAK